MNWEGKNVVIIGVARQGIALARYMIRHGAKVILNDHLSENEMQAPRASLKDLPIKWVLGGHPLSLLDRADLICVSGGVPLTLPLLIEAKNRGMQLSNDSQIFLEKAPCLVIGITGSAGKTTTTTLVGRMAQAAVRQSPFASPYAKVWVGGNIGSPLISYVDEISREDLAVMELSSFQLEIMTRSPQIATVLNLTPNHLDRHGTMEKYVAAKARILEFQKPNPFDGSQPVAILGRDDLQTWNLARRATGKVISFGIEKPPQGYYGTFMREDQLFLDGDLGEISLFNRQDILLRGEHNLLNVLAACAIAYAAGLPEWAMRAGVSGFTGVSHRLEFVRSWGGADWYNDSIATAPERAIAAMRSFNEPLILLAGGRDKNLPWEEFVHLVEQRVDHLITFGEAAEVITQILESSRHKGLGGNGQRPYTVDKCENLKKAVQCAAQIVSEGDVVLLAPGGTSFDEFRDFEDRGEAFRKWVMELP